jgi:uncharacterized protein YbbK (DUF523 family)
MYLISACLAGVDCRYDGKNARNESVVRLFESGQGIAVCPEVLGDLPIPRPPCEINRGEDRNDRVIDMNGIDRTDAFAEGAARTLAVCRAAGICKAILKQGSPSCGCGVIHDGEFTGVKIPGSGITARLLIENGIEVMSEEDWLDIPVKGIIEKDERNHSSIPTHR